MTINKNILATCWTWAGDAAPARGDETSPVPIARRIQAVADTGWTGINLVHADLATIRDDIGLPTLKTMLDDHGITTVEVEFITNWWTDGDMRRASDRLRDELFNAAAALGANVVKTGAELQLLGLPPARRAWMCSPRSSMNWPPLRDNTACGWRWNPCRCTTCRPSRPASTSSAVGNPHGGLTLDTWHVHRGGTGYADIEGSCRWSTSSSSNSTTLTSRSSAPLWDDTFNPRASPAKASWAPAFVASCPRSATGPLGRGDHLRANNGAAHPRGAHAAPEATRNTGQAAEASWPRPADPAVPSMLRTGDPCPTRSDAPPLRPALTPPCPAAGCSARSSRPSCGRAASGGRPIRGCSGC